MRARSDIFGALLGDQPCWPDRKHDEEQRENRYVDPSGIQELGRVAFDQTNDEPGNNRPFDIAEAPANHNRKALDDARGPRKRARTSTARSSAPLISASAEAMMKVSMIRELGLIPIRAAVSRSCETARSALPKKVNFINA